MASEIQKAVERQYGVPGTTETHVDVKLYAHIGKESNWESLSEAADETWETLATMSEDAQREFVYTGYEVELLYRVELATGKATLVAAEGVRLPRRDDI